MSGTEFRDPFDDGVDFHPIRLALKRAEDFGDFKGSRRTFERFGGHAMEPGGWGSWAGGFQMEVFSFQPSRRRKSWQLQRPGVLLQAPRGRRSKQTAREQDRF